VDIHAHSQGTIVTTDALQAYHRGHGFWGVFHSGDRRGDFKGTFYMYGNAVWFPPNVRTRSYVNDQDWVTIPLGTRNGPNVTHGHGGHSDYLCNGCNDPWGNWIVPPEPPLPMNPPPAHRGGGGCFVAGTRVTMADGTQRPIEDIQVGERVLALDERTGRVVPAPVTQVFVRPQWRDQADTVLIDGRVRATVNHPFLVNGEWKRADQIEPGDRLRRLSGVRDEQGDEAIESEAVQTLMPMPGVDTVYNLEVDTYHTYFVEGLLVHNRSAIPI
jgi:Pretoxin HINT domain